MARSVRIEFPGAYYHVMARGNRRGAIFVDEDDRRFFLRCLSEVCERTGWLVHAWVLMDNHYHLFIETPEGNLVDGMKWLQNTVTRRHNTRHARWGRLFGDRYKAVLVEGGLADYYATLWEYLHLNPARAGLVKAGANQSVLDYPWSSVAGGYALPPRQRPKWLAAAKGLEVMGYADTAAGRRKMVAHLDKRAGEEGRKSGWVELPEGGDRRMSHLRRGWYWGRQEFAEWALGQAAKVLGKGKSRGYTRSAERLEHGRMEAERLAREGLAAAGLSGKELEATRANDTRKVELARLIWRKTSASQTWIAERLGMRHAANVSLCLHRKKKNLKALPAGLRNYIEMQENVH